MAVGEAKPLDERRGADGDRARLPGRAGPCSADRRSERDDQAAIFVVVSKSVTVIPLGPTGSVTVIALAVSRSLTMIAPTVRRSLTVITPIRRSLTVIEATSRAKNSGGPTPSGRAHTRRSAYGSDRALADAERLADATCGTCTESGDRADAGGGASAVGNACAAVELLGYRARRTGAGSRPGAGGDLSSLGYAAGRSDTLRSASRRGDRHPCARTDALAGGGTDNRLGRFSDACCGALTRRRAVGCSNARSGADGVGRTDARGCSRSDAGR